MLLYHICETGVFCNIKMRNKQKHTLAKNAHSAITRDHRFQRNAEIGAEYKGVLEVLDLMDSL